MSVLDSNLSVSQSLNFLSASFESSVLDLQGATTLTSNGPVSFKKVNLNSKVLTLGSASTELKLTDANTALSLSGIALETGPGSLTLSGALTMSGNSKLNSSGGTITLNSGGSASSGTEISLPDTTLVLQNSLITHRCNTEDKEHNINNKR